MARFLRRPLFWIDAVLLLGAAGAAAGVLGRRAPVVLLYHDVSPAPEHVRGITPDQLDRQLAALRASGRVFVPLARIVEELEGGRAVPADWVAVTFDDSLRSCREHAAPVLGRHGAPATFFLCSGDFGHPGRLAAGDVRSMIAEGVDVGGHSLTHPWLPDLPEAEVAAETAPDRAALKAVGARADFFAYPFGALDARAARAAREAGYRAAFAVTPTGGWDMTDRFALRRVAPAPGSEGFRFRLETSGYWPAAKELACALLGVESPLRPGDRPGVGAWARGGLIAAAALAAVILNVRAGWRAMRSKKAMKCGP